jgi:biopolymer transport protein ExbD
MMPLPGKSLLRKRRAAEEAEMDITPMIDCTFLLLIFFLVASRMDAPLEIELPPARHGGAVVIKESIIITVAKGKGEQAEIYKGDNTDAQNLVEGANVVEQEDALVRYVEQQANTTPPKRYVLIKGEKGIKHREVARVAKAAARAEVEQLYVAVMEQN